MRDISRNSIPATIVRSPQPLLPTRVFGCKAFLHAVCISPPRASFYPLALGTVLSPPAFSLLLRTGSSIFTRNREPFSWSSRKFRAERCLTGSSRTGDFGKRTGGLACGRFWRRWRTATPKRLPTWISSRKIFYSPASTLEIAPSRYVACNNSNTGKVVYPHVPRRYAPATSYFAAMSLNEVPRAGFLHASSRLWRSSTKKTLVGHRRRLV